METYATALLYAIPGFVVLIVIEALYGHFKGLVTLRHMDTIASLSSGITNVVKDSLGLVVVIVSYEVMATHLALAELQASGWVYLVGFVCIDFAGYWSHRLAHSVNLFWNKHAIHHSSEEFNLPCALRQSVSNLVGIFSLFLLPAALLGVPPRVINLIAPLHLFLQFWYHTRYIPKLGWLEYVIITPSQHRVHHALNPEYLDKNLGQIFPWWDRMFGTFQEERDDVPPVYGITRPMQTWNPVKINFKHLFLLIHDAWRAQSWWDKLRIWFMPLGWRPADVAATYPVTKISDPYHFNKYHPRVSSRLIAWSWFQLVATLGLLLYMFASFGAIGFPDLLVYGAFLFASVYGFTSVMDLDATSLWLEWGRALAGLVLIFLNGDWFGMSTHLAGGHMLVAAYLLVTIIGSYYFYKTEIINPKETVVAQEA